MAKHSMKVGFSSVKKKPALKLLPAKSSLVAMKRAAKKASPSNRVDDRERSFGFFPSDVEAKVLSWPKL